MPSFRLVKSEVLPLTRELVQKHQQLAPSPTERELKPLRVRFLKGKIEQGLFLPPQWAVAIVNGKPCRMNGQHSSFVLSESDGDFPEGLYCHYDTFEVDSSAGMCELFRQFDARQSSRSRTDICGAYQGVYMPTDEFDAAITLRALDGFAWQMSTYEGVGGIPQGDDVGQNLHREDTPLFVRWFHSLDWSKFKEGKQKSVAAAMWITWSRNPDQASKFWDDVVHDRHDDPQEPAHLLSLELLAMLNRVPPYTNGNKVKPGKTYGLCIKAWNAYRKNHTMKKLEFNEKKELPEAAA
jgi:hypothetical protein